MRSWETFHAKRSRIGDYELEWLEAKPKPKVEKPKPKPKPKIEKPKSEFDKIKENKILNCWICGFPLNHRDRMDERCLALEKLDRNGMVIEEHFPRTLYKASKISGLSLCSLRNAIEKGNRLLVRRKDKQPFKLTWCSSHEGCFEDRKEKMRLEDMRKIDERVAKAKEKID